MGFFVRWNHRPGAFLAFQEGFGFLKHFFLVFFPPGLVKVLERSGPKNHFVKIQPPMDLFFLCTVSPKRNAQAFSLVIKFQKIWNMLSFFPQKFNMYTNKWGLGKGVSFHGNLGYSTSENWRVYKYNIYIYTLMDIPPRELTYSHLGKRKIIDSKTPAGGRDLLVLKRVYIPFKSKTGKRINHLPKS